MTQPIGPAFDGEEPRFREPTDTPFGANLEPVLRQACGGRLSTISWFRTDWQRGGALTGYAEYHETQGDHQPVVVKLPVPPGERRWLRRLQAFSNVVPRLLADGEELGGYDMAWVIMERMPHGPVSSAWDGCEFDLVIEAAGRFYHATSHFPVEGEPVHKDWPAILKSARDCVKESHLDDEKRWTAALKNAQRKLSQWIDVWESRPTDQWCHGDLHLANAMTRLPPPDGPAVLLDFARVHRGCWVEDAVYFEHLFWARRERLHGRKLSKLIAQERRKLGLPVHDDWPTLASTKRALLALTAPTTLEQHRDLRHLAAALEVLEIECK